MASEVSGPGRLSECFFELFAYGQVLKATCARKQPALGEVRETVRDLLHRSAQRMRALGVDPREYDDARFALCAWVDESIMNMPWTYRDEWAKHLLQTEHYGTTRAGEEFFDRLNVLRPEQAAVREVYYLCLCLGFAGRYCAPGDELLLEQVRRSNLRQLGRAPADVATFSAETIFDDSGRRPAPGTPPAGVGFWGLPRLALAVGVPAVVLLLFGIYRFVLNGVVDNLVGRVTGS